jgi:hypothetical protein
VIERKSDRGVTAEWLVGLKFNAKKEKLHFCHLPTYKKEHRRIQGNKRMLPPNFPQIHPSNIPLSQNSEKLN